MVERNFCLNKFHFYFSIVFFLLFFQPLRLDVKRKLSVRSDRVKCVDIHPNEPWILVTLYNGHAHIYNHDTQVDYK